MTSPSAPDAKLLIAPGCAYCPTVLQHLTALLKDNVIGKLEVINIHQHPEVAQQLNVRSVPWMQLGEFTLQGTHTLTEIRDYLEYANRDDGVRLYIEKQLSDGQLTSLLSEIKQHHHWLSDVIELLKDDDTSMQVRLGIDSLIESLAGTNELRGYVDDLGQLSNTVHVSRLADIIHYLGLTHSKDAITYIKEHSEHDNPDIRETCQDAIEEINSNQE